MLFVTVERGIYWFHVVCPSVHVRPSVRGQNHVHSVTSTILARSISYLHMLLSNFRRYVVCNVFGKIINFYNQHFLAKVLICNFDFVLFWLGIWYESIVWVIMVQQGVFSECRHSSFILEYVEISSKWKKTFSRSILEITEIPHHVICRYV